MSNPWRAAERQGLIVARASELRSLRFNVIIALLYTFMTAWNLYDIAMGGNVWDWIVLVIDLIVVIVSCLFARGHFVRFQRVDNMLNQPREEP